MEDRRKIKKTCILKCNECGEIVTARKANKRYCPKCIKKHKNKQVRKYYAENREELRIKARPHARKHYRKKIKERGREFLDERNQWYKEYTKKNPDLINYSKAKSAFKFMGVKSKKKFLIEAKEILERDVR